ncbi:hypothetical protein [Catellatospora paridis]|uniref:hypothetical protein n=1 Tax=Catellatospora paridis TaxID=1617086 RepID=UPI001E2C96D8|nr:hypothetical protein [Catellatospora paridis]
MGRTATPATLTELPRLVDQLAAASELRVVVFESANPDNFHDQPCGFKAMTGLRASTPAPTGSPPVFYRWRKREGTHLPTMIDVLRVTGGAITEIVTCHDDRFPGRPALRNLGTRAARVCCAQRPATGRLAPCRR